jgi:hypothetical protein
MAVPNSFPAWLSRPGQPDALVFNQAGYNAAAAQGYVYPTSVTGGPVTPRQAVSSQITISQLALNVEQDDGRLSSARR